MAMEPTMFFIPFLSVLMVLFCSDVSLVNASVANLTTDETALMEVRSHIMRYNPDMVVISSNWSTSVHVCEWIGVFCGGRHGRVMALNFSNMGVVGAVPPHLGNLSFLSSLDLTNNSFSGQLPKELTQLRRIQSIILDNNRLNGDIPTWLGTLPKLKLLSLFMNNFTGIIPLSLFNLSNLEILSLSFNMLHGNIPLDIAKLVNLQRFGIRQNNISGNIPSSIYNMSSLQRIVLSLNKLSGTLPDNMCNSLPNLLLLSLFSNEFKGQFPLSLGNCTSLRVLDLAVNMFSGRIPKTLGNLTNLQQLYMGDNNMEGEIPNEIDNLLDLNILHAKGMGLSGTIPRAIFKMSSLQQLDLSFNRLSGTLPDNICDFLPNLKLLAFAANELDGKLPLSLGNCSSLWVLPLPNNKFGGRLPRTLGNLTHLKDIYIERNSIEGELPKELSNILGLEIFSASSMRLTGTIPPTLFNLSSLVELEVSNNSLSGTLPSSFGIGVPNLKVLFLWGNNMSGVIPYSISNASGLTILELGSNRFSGSIPYTLGNLLQLERLILDDNNFSSESSTKELSFLSFLTNCRHLQVLSVSYNPLISGTLPISIGNLSTSLWNINMHHCAIRGQIPREIGSLTGLIRLSLDVNELEGSIPTTFQGLKSLQGLSIARNKLQGSIPSDLCHLKRLYGLQLSANNLEGKIPGCLTNLTSLRYLHLGFNNLNSTIPSTFWGLSDLLVVDFSSNFLVGNLSLDVGNLGALVVFDLSRNKLSSALPASIGGLKDLAYLSFANNDFQEHIPKSMGGLISLEYLDLSGNNLTGSIPKSFEALRHLKIFNVSFNRLEGQVPTRGTFHNFSAESYMGNYALCGLPRLHMPSCKETAQTKKSFSHLFIKIFLPTIVLVTLMALSIIIFIKRRTPIVRLPKEESSILDLVVWRRISRLDIVRATDGFNETNLLGVGAFGSVYKGILSDETIVAVKVFNLQVETALKSFDVKSEIYRNVRHRNLVKVISSCSDIGFKALVLEFMPKGSLDNWLYAHNYFLDINERLNIIIDVAAALEYLYYGYSTPVVHCDLKPSNVLLDENKIAHLSDFGISKLFEERGSMAETITLATVGYMAPEYGSMGIISMATDVYSYGILVMETVTRTKPTDDMFGGELSLKDWVKQSLQAGVVEVVDVNLLTGGEQHFTAKLNCLSSVLALADSCSSDAPEERGNMTDVLSTLQKIRQKFFKDMTFR